MSHQAQDAAAAADEFRRARALFEAALEQPPGERLRFVEGACADDAPLLAIVRDMLRADADRHPLLDGAVPVDRWQAGETFAGQFRILGLLGRGGMGEVFRAFDATLGREVALKVLPSTDVLAPGRGERLARLQREAQMLAALSHPNIAAIYGLAEADGVHALVLELVDGPTLAERIQSGRMLLDEVITVARQIAIGLEAAHEEGIVHRDLKPANIKLRADGTVKLLDFGLAKAVQPESAIDSAPTMSPAITSPSMIQRGALLGTAAYMSPEQARGREADRRSDIWAFGAVLYEMLAGDRAFKGDDVADTLAAVLRADVDRTRLPESTPNALRLLLARCLDRDVSRRLRDIGEARVVLEDLSQRGPSSDGAWTTPGSGHTPLARRLVGPAIAATVAALGVAAVTWPRETAPAPPVTRFALTMPGDQSLLLDPQSRDLAITPDGSRVIYKGGSRVDLTQLFVYPLDQLDPSPITSGSVPKGPFASPDGQWVGFFEPGQPGAALRKVAISGGPPIEISRLDGPSRGATWGEDDAIVAASGTPATGLLRIPSAGGAFTVLTRPDRERGENDHLWPQFLPGSKAVLYTITDVSGELDAARVAVFDTVAGTSKTLIRGASQAHYVSSGHLVYLAGGALWGIGFDAERLETIGTPTVVVPQVVVLPTGVAEFDIGRDGTLVFVARGGASAAPRTLVWVDRRGQEEALPAPPRAYSTLRISPDGTRVAVEIEDQQNDIWVWNFARETLTRVTSDPGLDKAPLWTPDGKRLIFTSQTGGVLGALFWQAADGSGEAERLTDATLIQRASAMLPDGSGILFSEGGGVNLLRLDGPRRVETVIRTAQGGGSGVVSPDGKWLAYVERETSSSQVFVSPFANPSQGRTLVSKDGGMQPRWSSDGRELYFAALDGGLMSVSVSGGATLSIGTPSRVVDKILYNGLGLFERPAAFDVAPDGKRFLMLKPVNDPSRSSEAATVIVVRNWIEELKRLMAPRSAAVGY